MHNCIAFLTQIPHEYARRHLVLGEELGSGQTRLACGPGLDPLTRHNIAVRLGLDPASLTTHEEDREALAHRIDEAYLNHSLRDHAPRAMAESVPVIQIEIPGGSAPDPEQELARLASGADRDLLNLEGKGPVVRLVDAVFFDAIHRQASDVHIQPLGDATLVRYRIDGVLLTARRIAPGLAPAIISRIKVMARMDVAERRAPQDGRATVTIGRGEESRSIDLRISTLPSAYGERMVIRLLDNAGGRQQATIEAIGMPAQMRPVYLDRAGRSAGIVLVTGPTGSGKTTTLYATLRWLIARSFTGKSAADVNVMTIEDPIEYDLTTPEPGSAGLPISQTQVDPKKGMNFATGLRHILRQDPDVIMVGEIRDAETARIAIQASLTGHLVFSTLHTGDAPGAVTRLLDLDVEPFLVASTLSCVLAQRLVRTVHQPCNGTGCEGCLHSGYKGRRGIFELLVMDEAVRELVTRRANALELRNLAVARGMRRLEDEGRQLVSDGITTLAEVQRVTLGVE